MLAVQPATKKVISGNVNSRSPSTDPILNAGVNSYGRKCAEGELRPNLIFDVSRSEGDIASDSVSDSAPRSDHEIAAVGEIKRKIELPVSDEQLCVRAPSAYVVEVESRTNQVSFIVDIFSLMKEKPSCLGFPAPTVGQVHVDESRPAQQIARTITKVAGGEHSTR